MTIPAAVVQSWIASLLMTPPLTPLGYAAGYRIFLHVTLTPFKSACVHQSLCARVLLAYCLMSSFGLQLFPYIHTDTKNDDVRHSSVVSGRTHIP